MMEELDELIAQKCHDYFMEVAACLLPPPPFCCPISFFSFSFIIREIVPCVQTSILDTGMILNMFLCMRNLPFKSSYRSKIRKSNKKTKTETFWEDQFPPRTPRGTALSAWWLGGDRVPSLIGIPLGVMAKILDPIIARTGYLFTLCQAFRCFTYKISF